MAERFSGRHGYKSVRSVIQVDDLDDRTRNRLWSYVGQHLPGGDLQHFGWPYIEVWDEIFGISSLHWPDYQNMAYRKLGLSFGKDSFFTVFDILETLADNLYKASPTKRKDCHTGSYKQLQASVNFVFEQEAVGYRMVQRRVVPIVLGEQLEAIDKALGNGRLTDGARLHLEKALSMLRTSEGASPSDAIREAIHAVEAEAKAIADMPKATLGDALNKLAREKPLNSALKDTMNKLYGYTSSEKGIRHANDSLRENATAADAVFVIITCSAFLSWLQSHDSTTA